MQIDELRSKIDIIDRQIAALFCERIDIAADIGAIKKENAVPVLDGQREKEVLRNAVTCVPQDIKPYAERLFTEIMRLSREFQNNL